MPYLIPLLLFIFSDTCISYSEREINTEGYAFRIWQRHNVFTWNDELSLSLCEWFYSRDLKSHVFRTKSDFCPDFQKYILLARVKARTALYSCSFDFVFIFISHIKYSQMMYENVSFNCHLPFSMMYNMPSSLLRIIASFLQVFERLFRCHPHTIFRIGLYLLVPEWFVLIWQMTFDFS